jgi:hypothetical protein
MRCIEMVLLNEQKIIGEGFSRKGSRIRMGYVGSEILDFYFCLAYL